MFKNKAMVEKSKEIRIKSSIEGIHELEAFVEDICYEYNIFNSYYSSIQLALNEAFNNARMHGNKDNPDLWIDVSFFSDQKGLHFIVKDEGVGFDYKRYTEKDIDDLLLEEGSDAANGILVIKMLVDELNFMNSGNTIELIFYISSINYSLTLERARHLKSYFNSVSVFKAD